MTDLIRNRIKGHRRVRAGDLVPHEFNWRWHPDRQRAALEALYRAVGFARSLLAYELPDGRLKLIDGHLRRELMLPVRLEEAEGSALDRAMAREFDQARILFDGDLGAIEQRAPGPDFQDLIVAVEQRRIVVGRLLAGGGQHRQAREVRRQGDDHLGVRWRPQ